MNQFFTQQLENAYAFKADIKYLEKLTHMKLKKIR